MTSLPVETKNLHASSYYASSLPWNKKRRQWAHERWQVIPVFKLKFTGLRSSSVVQNLPSSARPWIWSSALQNKVTSKQASKQTPLQCADTSLPVCTLLLIYKCFTLTPHPVFHLNQNVRWGEKRRTQAATWVKQGKTINKYRQISWW